MIDTPSRIATLDLGSRALGWARWRFVEHDDNELTHGHYDLTEEALTEDPWERVDLFARWFTRWVDEFAPELVVLEEPFFPQGGSGTQSIRLLNAIYGFARVILLRRGVMVRDVTRSEAVKATLGWASRKNPETDKMVHATKDEVREAINRLYGFEIVSDDEADAMATMRLILGEIAGTGRVRPDKAEVAEAKATHRREVKKRTKAREAKKRQQLPLTLPPILSDEFPEPPAAAKQLQEELMKRRIPAALVWPGSRKARGRKFMA
jgi:Holliday junction resolvasome RuvABC endonuclease subunit